MERFKCTAPKLIRFEIINISAFSTFSYRGGDFRITDVESGESFWHEVEEILELWVWAREYFFGKHRRRDPGPEHLQDVFLNIVIVYFSHFEISISLITNVSCEISVWLALKLECS